LIQQTTKTTIMKKTLSLASVLLISGLAFSGETTTVSLISSGKNSNTIEFKPGDYATRTVATPKGDAGIFSMDKGTRLLLKGAPDLVQLTTSIIIPDEADMQIKVISSEYYEVQNTEIAPSKGNLTRDINPANIPFTYGDAYTKNEFFPASIVSLGAPYIVRDYRGIPVHAVPFQYNPVSKVLRVYTSIVVEVSVKNEDGGDNIFERSKNEVIADPEFDVIYERHFINYKSTDPKTQGYTPLSETGSMLVICYDQFAPDMQPFVKWKNQKGIQCDMILKSVAGSTAAAIKTYIQNYYTSHPALKYVLLVGDAAQVPASSTPNGDSDNNYGYLTGSDSYPELFVGRFSAQNSTHVQTMVNRTINYEKTPQANGSWYSKGTCIGSDQGPGDDNEYDWQHERKIRGKLLGYNFNGSPTYTNVSEIYDGSQGGLDAAGFPTSTDVTTEVNSGTGLINYTGHGSDISWGTTGFSVSTMSGLTNTSAHPFIISVGCVNGNFVPNSTCFAEAWLRAGTPAAPKGASATMMSTVNQSWDPPMEGQDAMMDILVESVAGNIKRTFGGIAMNGCMEMNDTYGAAGAEMTDTWNYFGDPSIMMFTKAPMAMTTTHNATEAVGVASITVNNNVNGALVCLSVNGVILGTGISNGTNATITFPAINTSGTVIDVVATSYNYMPYTGTITVTGATGIYNYESDYSFSAYPVPADNILNISLQNQVSGNIKVSIINAIGQETVRTTDVKLNTGETTFQMNVSDLSEGLYFCKIETANATMIKKVAIK
jgi:hypothetical protein